MRVATRFLSIAGATLALGIGPIVLQHGSPAVAEDAVRILSLGGDITEILYDLGQQDKVVAVDTTSQFPEDALKTKKSVGYLRALSAEGVLSVNPTLIIASDDAGPPEVVKALKSSGVKYIDIADKKTPDGVTQKVRHIGSIVGADDAAKTLAAKIEADFGGLESDRKKITARKKVLFILAIQKGRATVAGSGTSADSVLHLAGADNAAAAITGFKPVSDEQLTEFAPDAVVVMRRGAADEHRAGQALTLTGLSQSPAFKTKSIIEMDGLYLLGFGPRAPAAARELMTSLYADPGKTGAIR